MGLSVLDELDMLRNNRPKVRTLPDVRISLSMEDAEAAKLLQIARMPENDYSQRQEKALACLSYDEFGFFDTSADDKWFRGTRVLSDEGYTAIDDVLREFHQQFDADGGAFWEQQERQYPVEKNGVLSDDVRETRLKALNAKFYGMTDDMSDDAQFE